jgi:hypothetical protein
MSLYSNLLKATIATAILLNAIAVLPVKTVGLLQANLGIHSGSIAQAEPGTCNSITLSKNPTDCTDPGTPPASWLSQAEV